MNKKQFNPIENKSDSIKNGNKLQSPMHKTDTSVALNPEDIQLFTQTDLDTGFEGTDIQTFKTPFLRILQTLSPELKKSDPKFISNAEEGMFCNSATQECYEQISIIVLKIEHSLIIWKPDRGGFIGRYPKFKEEEIVSSRDGLYKFDAEGNSIIDTIEFYCLNLKNPLDIFIFPMSTASLKHAKSFATRLRMLKVQGKPVGVSWAGIWNIDTVEESNDKGSWFTIGSTPEFVRLITKEERNNWVFPAKEMLKNATTDYSTIDAAKDQEDQATAF